ncbi:MAG: AsnC family transcriptional regulator [Planctomycetes bacterium]|nr:AsnC family transcriptional regulator [Planctomycetota bacterium]
MDDLDRRILTELQDDFPLSERPYDIIAGRLDIDADTLWQRALALLESGVIRRLGASLDSRKLGYSSTLAAICVPEPKVDEASDLLNNYVEVTHSYLREGRFNIWFTIIAANTDEIDRILSEIAAKLDLGLEDVLNAPVERLFKLDARFKAGG